MGFCIQYRFIAHRDDVVEFMLYPLRPVQNFGAGTKA